MSTICKYLKLHYTGCRSPEGIVDLRLHLLFCRLDQYLEYVVTYTDDTAFIQAEKADHLFSEVGYGLHKQ